MDESSTPQALGVGFAGVERIADGAVAERSDGDRDETRAEVAVGVEIARGQALDRRVVDVDGTRDQRCRDVGRGRVARQHGDRLGDAQAQAAAATPAGRDAAHR